METPDIRLFFDRSPGALPLYAAFETACSSRSGCRTGWRPRAFSGPWSPVRAALRTTCP